MPMPRDGISFEVVGEADLRRKLDALMRVAPKKVISGALRKSAKRLKVDVVAKLSSAGIHTRTGRYAKGLAGMKIRSLSRSRVRTIISLVFPERDLLGISPNDKHYFPAALEYGGGPGKSQPRPHPHIRPAVDENADRELRQIAVDIKNGIEAEAMRLKSKGKT